MFLWVLYNNYVYNQNNKQPVQCDHYFNLYRALYTETHPRFFDDLQKNDTIMGSLNRIESMPQTLIL